MSRRRAAHACRGGSRGCCRIGVDIAGELRRPAPIDAALRGKPKDIFVSSGNRASAKAKELL